VIACVPEEEHRWRLIDALYRGAWAEGRRVDQPEVVARIADEVGQDGLALVEQAASTEAKARLRQATDDAIRRGAFGVPTIFVEGEMYWGVDSLPYLDAFLSGERAIDQAGIARWRAVVPSAVRRGAR
jgi:2-hydroxychromene-2-carboxylate isomerase